MQAGLFSCLGILVSYQVANVPKGAGRMPFAI